MYNKKIKREHLPKERSIFNAEICTIDLALNFISRSKKSLITAIKN